VGDKKSFSISDEIYVNKAFLIESQCAIIRDTMQCISIFSAAAHPYAGCSRT
jgi:hypothetical protein